MGFPWKKLAGLGEIGLHIVEFAVPAVKQVEDVARTILAAKGKGLSSKEKQELALTFIKASLASAEGLSGQDLLNDVKVEAAARSVIDAVVAFQNAVAEAMAARELLTVTTTK